MQIEIASCTYQGGRDYNEDCVQYLEKDGTCAIVVADGLGGHGGGQIASSVAAEFITGAFMYNPELRADHIKTIFEQANDAVLKSQTNEKKMKSTAVALFIADGSAIWGHVGDSRLYHFKDGTLVGQTLDHSVSQMAVFTGEIEQGQIRHHADRNRVLRAIGLDEGFKPEIAPMYEPEPGFHAFLLCTDGFWEYVLELEMEIELAKAETPHDWINGMVYRLARLVPEDSDNFSAAAVFLKAGV